MWQCSKDHLTEAGETYAQHLRFAMLVGVIAMGAGLACVIHALVPGLCQRTCSRTVGHLQQLFRSRDQWREVQRQASGLLVFMMLGILAAASALPYLALGGSSTVVALVGGLALSIPATFLLTNPDLEMIN